MVARQRRTILRLAVILWRVRKKVKMKCCNVWSILAIAACAVALFTPSHAYAGGTEHGIEVVSASAHDNGATGTNVSAHCYLAIEDDDTVDDVIVRVFSVDLAHPSGGGNVTGTGPGYYDSTGKTNNYHKADIIAVGARAYGKPHGSSTEQPWSAQNDTGVTIEIP
jgi:hypothetical protein